MQFSAILSVPMRFSDVPNFLRRSLGVTTIVLASTFFLALPHHAFASKVLAVKFDAQDRHFRAKSPLKWLGRSRV